LSASFSANWSRGLALLVSGLLGLVLVWMAVQLLWLILAGPQVATQPMPPVPQVQPTATARDGFRWDLFGEAPAAARIIAAPVVESSGSLRLKGIMAGGADAFAIIADERGRERPYRVGSELPDGATVEEIEALRVIVLRNGRREALALERAETGRAQSAAPRTASPDRPELTGVRGFQAPAGISAASLQAPATPGDSIADQISILPVAGGGFRVRPGRDASLFAELGLQVNDIVLAVNGQPLTSEDDARALFADIVRRGELSITINRQGREMTLRPDLDQILSRL